MKLILFILLGCFSLITYTQATQYYRDCDFLKNPKFTKGVDTVFVIGYKTSIFRTGPPVSSLLKLTKEKKVRYRVRTGLSFRPVNCSTEISADCIDSSPFSYTPTKEDSTRLVKLRCLIFEGYKQFGKQYFVIDKVTPYKD